MLLAVAEQLQIPFRDRNDLLLAAGHAPAFPERALSDPELEPVREALDRILVAHEPYPALVFDRAWNHVASNAPMARFASWADVDPALLEPPVNILRLGLHPRGMAPLIINLAHWHAHFLARLERQIALSGPDGELRSLRDEVAAYPIPEQAGDPEDEPDAAEMLGPVRVRVPGGGELSLLGMYAGFDTPFEVTASELAIELLYPADRATSEAFEKGAP